MKTINNISVLDSTDFEQKESDIKRSAELIAMYMALKKYDETRNTENFLND